MESIYDLKLDLVALTIYSIMLSLVLISLASI